MAADVIVIGGGLVGSALTYGLVEAGARVTMLDEGDVAFRASRGNFGLVWVQSKGDGMHEYASWTRISSDLWGGFAEALQAETGVDVGHHRPGGLELCLDEEEYDAYAGSIRRMHNQPDAGANDRSMIDGDEVRRMEPHVGPEVIGASFCPHDGVVNPLLALRALHAIANRAGVVRHSTGPVTGIRPDGDGFRVDTADGSSWFADRVVLAAGNGNRALAGHIGLEVPVSPERGHILVTEPVRPLFNHVLGQVRQTDEGTVMLGATKESVGFDTGIAPDMIRTISSRAVRKVPLLRRLQVIRAWSALRIMSPDGFPIYAESAEYPGAFVVTCHSGVTLAAAHALRLAPRLLQPGFNEHFAAFSPGRFDVSQADRPGTDTDHGPVRG